MSSPKPIIISGAGPAGLLLARSLQKHRIPFLLYERDPAGSSRSQGYRIRISAQGLNAISAVLSSQDYQRFLDGCSNNGPGKIIAYDANTMTPKDFPGNGVPRGGGEVMGVSRAFVRNTLFEGIEDLVHFNKNLVGYEMTASGVIAQFSDGTTSPEGSLLVGADGIHSNLTKQLTNGTLKVYDTGARMIHGSSPKSAFEGLAKGRFGAFSVFDETNAAGKVAMITNVRDEAGENVRFGWVLVGAPGTFSTPGDDFSVTGQPAADISMELTKDWSSVLRPIFERQEVAEAAFLKMSTSSPDGVPEWPNEPRVTLLGDAVHAMTPAGGVGANTALRDAELLGRLLGEEKGWRKDITEAFESEMRVYASQNVKDSWDIVRARFNVNELGRAI